MAEPRADGRRAAEVERRFQCRRPYHPGPESTWSENSDLTAVDLALRLRLESAAARPSDPASPAYGPEASCALSGALESEPETGGGGAAMRDRRGLLGQRLGVNRQDHNQRPAKMPPFMPRAASIQRRLRVRILPVDSKVESSNMYASLHRISRAGGRLSDCARASGVRSARVGFRGRRRLESTARGAGLKALRSSQSEPQCLGRHRA